MDTKVKDIISVVLDGLGDNFNTLNYVYNDRSKFIPGINTVYYSGPYFTKDEIVAMIDSIITGKWLSSGEKVHQFEIQFGKKINQNYAVMVNSGSSANLVMIAALKKYFGWQDEDEIILSVVGFPTTLAPIIQNNLKPVFIDIEMDTLNFDLELIEEKITNKTKGIFVSPVLGNPPNFDTIIEICNKYDLQLILDNCDSLGSKWNDKYLNEYAIASSYSFYPAHHISTMEGGMVTSNIKEIIDLARSFAWWGRSCFLKDTKIYTKNGDKNIQDIDLNDEVFTHNGNYIKPNNIFHNKYSGNIIKIDCEKGYDIQSTEDHKFLVLKTGGNKLYKFTKNGGNLPDLQWMSANEIEINDYLVEKIIENNTIPNAFIVNYKTLIDEKTFFIPYEKNILRLIGYWMAQGSTTKSKKGSNGKGGKNKNKYYKYRTEFGFHKKDIDQIEDVIDLMNYYFGISCYINDTNKKSNGISLNFNSRKAFEFFRQFGNRSYNKSLPEFIINSHKDYVKQFLIGFWRGDGCSWNGSENRLATYNFSTSSEKLAKQINKLLLRFQINPSMYIRKPEDHKTSIVNGKEVIARRDLYNINLYGKNAKTFSEMLKNGQDNFSSKKYRYFTDDGRYAIYKVIGIEKKHINNLDVYDLSIPNDNSYHANGYAVHNCYCVGSANLLPEGTCNHRFDCWLKPEYNGIVDHKYIFENIGYNLKPLDLQGAVGLIQLQKFDEIHERRKNSREIISEMFLKYIDGIKIQDYYTSADVSWFGTGIICKSRELKEKLVSYLEKNKIQTRSYFAGNILLHEAYKEFGNWQDYPNANKVLSQIFFVGAAPHYDMRIFKYIENVLKDFKYE